MLVRVQSTNRLSYLAGCIHEQMLSAIALAVDRREFSRLAFGSGFIVDVVRVVGLEVIAGLADEALGVVAALADKGFVAAGVADEALVGEAEGADAFFTNPPGCLLFFAGFKGSVEIDVEVTVEVAVAEAVIILVTDVVIATRSDSVSVSVMVVVVTEVVCMLSQLRR